MHEFKAKARLCTLLKKHGFSIRDVRGMPTAFTAAYGAGKPHIALLAEYDALEGMGHACGHHLIAGMSVLSAIGIASMLKSKGGTIHVIGCPAEETIGGKAVLVKKGIFGNIDAAFMIHPADKTEIVKLSLSLQRLGVTFRGISSHASATPWKGKNALTGLQSLFQTIDINRITMNDGDKINGIIKQGGTAANIIPDAAHAEFFLRSKQIESHHKLLKRFITMVKGTAKAFGLDYEIHSIGNVYYPLRPHLACAKLFALQLKKLHVKIDNFFTDNEMGSSDIGNVSAVIPTLHPTLAITDTTCPAHSEAFKKQADTPEAYRALATGSLLLALTAMELYKKPDLLSSIKNNTMFNIVDHEYAEMLKK